MVKELRALRRLRRPLLSFRTPLQKMMPGQKMSRHCDLLQRRAYFFPHRCKRCRCLDKECRALRKYRTILLASEWTEEHCAATLSLKLKISTQRLGEDENEGFPDAGCGNWSDTTNLSFPDPDFKSRYRKSFGIQHSGVASTWLASDFRSTLATSGKLRSEVNEAAFVAPRPTAPDTISSTSRRPTCLGQHKSTPNAHTSWG